MKSSTDRMVSNPFTEEEVECHCDYDVSYYDGKVFDVDIDALISPVGVDLMDRLSESDLEDVRQKLLERLKDDQ